MELGFTKITGAASDHLKKLRYEDKFESFNDIYKLYSGPFSPFPIPNVSLKNLSFLYIPT